RLIGAGLIDRRRIGLGIGAAVWSGPVGVGAIGRGGRAIVGWAGVVGAEVLAWHVTVGAAAGVGVRERVVAAQPGVERIDPRAEEATRRDEGRQASHQEWGSDEGLSLGGGFTHGAVRQSRLCATRRLTGGARDAVRCRRTYMCITNRLR